MHFLSQRQWSRLVLCTLLSGSVAIPLSWAPLSWADEKATNPAGTANARISRPVATTAGDQQGVRAQVFQQADADGTTYSAIALRGKNLAPVAGPQELIVLVDTSASQVGAYRQGSLELVSELLKSLPQEVTVRVAAVDVGVESLMGEFASSTTPAAVSAVQQLKMRTPLGATNLPAALDEVSGWFTHKGPRHILYIGDGHSTAEYVSIERFQTTLSQLEKQQVAVHSYVLGPKFNGKLIGSLAQQTGGALWCLPSATPAADAPQVAASVTAPILRVEEFQVEGDAAFELIPARGLPLRSDRETVYLGRGTIHGEELTIRGEVAGRAVIEKYNLSPSSAHAAFLPAFVRQVISEKGITNSLAGLEALGLASSEFEEGSRLLAARAEKASREGDRQVLAQLAAQAEVLSVQSAAIERLVAAPQEAPAASAPMVERTVPGQGPSLLDEREQLIRVQAEKLRQQVSSTVQFARSAVDSGAALDELKRSLTAVRSAIDINTDERVRLERVLGSEILATTNRIEKENLDRVRNLERSAQLEAQQRLVEQSVLDDERLANLIDRIRALMNAGWHGDDAAFSEAEAVARVAVDLEPNSGAAAAALFNAEAATQLRRVFRLKSRRADMFLETLYQVELSHVPFPDEPPIVFPPAEVWKALSERRKRYQSVDLRQNSPNEQKILSALDQPTEVEFIDTSLKDALDFIEDLHKIEIWINEAKIMEEGIAIDQPVNLQLSGVSLRSALRLMLEPLQLTYVIRNEVMEITTLTDAETALSTRVYPVADLVIPIQSFFGAGGLGGGNNGQQNGGQQNGLGGQGGQGGQQGFGGGGGGNFFSLPAEQLKKNQTR